MGVENAPESLGLQLFVDMPYEILRLESHSHPDSLLIKRSATKATVQLIEGTSLDCKPFSLHVTLANPYQPR